MTINQFFDSQDEIRIKIFKALADPIRLQIIRILNDKKEELSCGEMGQLLNMSKSAASYHFKTLREAGLTSTRKAGQNKFVQLNKESFQSFLPGFLESLTTER
ncbi:ArsR/SmtB family transcription factor [Streptococcus macacae]|uniref:Transcriptional regulator, ArsR family n=1 Tax=Streptococcus macacae NCTC 11558 TaxID=764298 RepID=G5JX18_9STRE|nr:metalloregulator ArsR/SmtB family transcription factor [Streptococcus macacae]EHJ52198.1 transcriptional regulator, ArsR family [Streptococcus macacae NCTC 11558]SUN79497.1 ArsR family transcriptional regulator [Streptococcus macacae NCTC 11558]